MILAPNHNLLRPNRSLYRRGYGRLKPPPGARIDFTHPLARSLMMAYLFHDGSVRNLPGIISTTNYGTQPAAGPFGPARYFATTDYLLTSAFPLTPPALTVVVGLKGYPHATIHQTILSDADQQGTSGYIWCVRIAPTDNLRWEYAHGTGYTNVTAVNIFAGWDGRPLSLAVTADYDSKLVTCYRNGEPFSQSSMSAGTPLFPTANRTKYIGAYNPTAHRLQNTTVDYFYLYNRLLAAAEIAALYNEPFA